MALRLPSSLSPSKVSSFTSCALAFKFSSLLRVPEPPTVAASKGTLVHTTLENLFLLPSDERTLDAAYEILDRASDDFHGEADYQGLELDESAAKKFEREAKKLVEKYFKLEDPTRITPVGLELRMEAQIGDLRLRGIIDRLELDEDGGLVVTDYKTGRTPMAQFEQSKLGGVHFYAFMVEQLFGRRPSKVQLLHLADPVAIINTPTEQSIRGLSKRVSAIWVAITRACERDDFRPKPGKLCDWCSYKPFCPAHGGDPSLAPTEVEVSIT